MTPALVQDLGVLSEALKAAPSAVSAVLLIVVVFAFLKHERQRDLRVKEMLDGAMQMNREQREEHTKSLELHTERMTTAMSGICRNLEHLAEGHSRILEAVRECGVKR